MPLLRLGGAGLQTDSTRVITVEFSDLGPNTGGFPSRGYHQLTHHGKVASYIKELSIIERFHTKQFGRFLDKLSAVREPNDRTLLDNTMALLGSGMGMQQLVQQEPAFIVGRRRF